MDDNWIISIINSNYFLVKSILKICPLSGQYFLEAGRFCKCPVIFVTFESVIRTGCDFCYWLHSQIFLIKLRKLIMSNVFFKKFLVCNVKTE